MNAIIQKIKKNISFVLQIIGPMERTVPKRDVTALLQDARIHLSVKLHPLILWGDSVENN